MVELRPSSLKLETGPGQDVFIKAMENIGHRFVDVLDKAQTDNNRFLNGPDSVSFELRQPTTCELSLLTCVAGQLKPHDIDYMHAFGDHCIVYWMTWKKQEKKDDETGSK